MEPAGQVRTAAVCAVSATLEELGDAELWAVIVRAQGLLLDRPVPPNTMAGLAVEIVDGEEGRLLAIYRALPARARRRLLHRAELLAHPSRRKPLRTESPTRVAAGA